MNFSQDILDKFGLKKSTRVLGNSDFVGAQVYETREWGVWLTNYDVRELYGPILKDLFFIIGERDRKRGYVLISEECLQDKPEYFYSIVGKILKDMEAAT